MQKVPWSAVFSVRRCCGDSSPDLLALCSIVAVSLVLTSRLSSGHEAMWSILAVGLFNSIMFPTIFTLGVAELGPITGNGSGILNLAIVAVRFCPSFKA
jgi:FHS family L-fucose permease-like MFS transporter